MFWPIYKWVGFTPIIYQNFFPQSTETLPDVAIAALEAKERKISRFAFLGKKYYHIPTMSFDPNIYQRFHFDPFIPFKLPKVHFHGIMLSQVQVCVTRWNSLCSIKSLLHSKSSLPRKRWICWTDVKIRQLFIINPNSWPSPFILPPNPPFWLLPLI